MASETTLTDLVASATQIRESEDTPQGSSRLRSLPTTLIWGFLATTPIGLSAYDSLTRDLVIARNTISMEEENSLASLSIAADIDTSNERTVRTIEAKGDAANRVRLELLARQYVNKQLSREEDARLSIATERVRRLIPRITAEEFEALERIAVRLNSIESEDADRRKRLGIT